MSNIAEQKALGEYPKINHPYSTDVEREIDAKRAYYRTAYIVGYDQAVQDMTDKVQKIRGEIEKKRQLIWPTNTGEMAAVDVPKQLVQGWLNALKWMEDLIDSTNERVMFNVGDRLQQDGFSATVMEIDDKGYHCDNAYIPFSAQDKWTVVNDNTEKDKTK